VTNDKYAKRIFHIVFVTSRGGVNRIRIVKRLLESPLNTNQLAKELGLDFKAVQHHVKVLVKNNILASVGEKYNVAFFPSTFLDENMNAFEEIVSKLEQGK